MLKNMWRPDANPEAQQEIESVTKILTGAFKRALGAPVPGWFIAASIPLGDDLWIGQTIYDILGKVPEDRQFYLFQFGEDGVLAPFIPKF